MFPIGGQNEKTVGSGHASSEQQLHPQLYFSSVASSALGASLAGVASDAAPASEAAMNSDAVQHAAVSKRWREDRDAALGRCKRRVTASALCVPF